MIYRAKVVNGQIVLEGNERLPEGMLVKITVIEKEENPPRGSAAAILKYAGIWADQEADMEKSLAELKAMKEEEVRRQMSEPDEQLP